MTFKSAFLQDISHCNILNLQLHEPQWSTKVVQFARNLNYLHWSPRNLDPGRLAAGLFFLLLRILNRQEPSNKCPNVFEERRVPFWNITTRCPTDTDRYAELKVVSIQNWSPPSLSFYLYITRQIAATVQSRCLMAPWRISLFNQGPLSHNLT